MAVSENFLRNWNFKLNITDGITDGIIKKILIFNYPSVTRPNKKPESPYFIRDRPISYYYSSFSCSFTSSSSSSSLYVKKSFLIYFFLFFSLLISFSFPSCLGMSSSSFFFYPLSFFLINMLNEIFFLSLASLATTLR